MRALGIGQWQFDDESRPGWGVLFCANGPAVFLNDFRSDSEAQARPARPFGRREDLKNRVDLLGL